MQLLTLFSRINLYSMETRDLVAFIEKIVVQRKNTRDDGERVKDAGLVEEGVDSVGVGAFEGISSGESVGRGHVVDFSEGVLDEFGLEEGGEEDVAVLLDELDVFDGLVILWKFRRRLRQD